MQVDVYVDDSVSNTRRPRRVYLLGALIATPDQWSALSAEWQVTLNLTPELAYFKMSEALSLKKQFCVSRGWTEDLRDVRVSFFARLVAKYVQTGVVVVLDHATYERVVRDVAQGHPTRDPYLACLFNLVDLVAREKQKWPTANLRYFLDEHGAIGRQALTYWDNMMTIGGIEWIAPRPSFHTDDSCYPLQATDLFCGVARNGFEGRRIIDGPLRRAADELDGLAKCYGELSYEHMLRMSANMVLARVGLNS